MKNWKVIVLTVFVILLVAILTFSVRSMWETREIRSQIKQFKLIREREQLTLDILNIRYDTAVIQAKFQSAAQPTEAKGD